VKDYKRSQDMAAKIKAREKECWANAFRALDEIPDAIYIEGWALGPDGLMFEHGWLELDGVIIDPTLNDPTYPISYYPGIRFTRAEIREAMSKAKEDLPIYWFMIKTGGHPDYKAAFDQALKDFNDRRKAEP